MFKEAFGAVRVAREWGDRAPWYNGEFAFGSPASEKVVFGVFGDSVGCGLGVTHIDRTFAGSVARRLAESRPVLCRIKAVSGARARDLSGQPVVGDERLAAISIGTNDILQVESFSDMEYFLCAFLEGLRRAERVVVLGPGDLAGALVVPSLLRGLLGNRVLACEAALRRAVARFPNACHFGPSELAQSLTAEDYAEDGFHPNERAHATIADGVYSRLTARSSGRPEPAVPAAF